MHRGAHDDPDGKGDRGHQGHESHADTAIDTRWFASKPVEIDMRQGLRVRVNENHAVNVERRAVFLELSSRGTVGKAGSHPPRLHFGDVASPVAGDEIIGAQTERDRLAVGEQRPGTANLALEDLVAARSKSAKAPCSPLTARRVRACAVARRFSSRIAAAWLARAISRLHRSRQD